MTFRTTEFGDAETLQLLRRSVAALATLTGIEATFTHGVRSDTMEAALDDLPGGSFGVLRFGGDAGVAIDLVAVNVDNHRTTTLIISSPPIKPTRAVGIERLYGLLENLPPHCRPTLAPHDEPFPSVAVAGMRTAVALTLDPDINAGLIDWAILSLRDAHAALNEWLDDDETAEWWRDCPE